MLRQNGYANATRSTGMPRDVEYQLFTRVTGKLNAAKAMPERFADLAEALNENLTLWQTLALEIAQSDNGLPAQLRAQIFYLYEFTRKHTQRVLHDGAEIDALIDINTAIMRGLRSAPGTSDEANRCLA